MLCFWGGLLAGCDGGSKDYEILVHIVDRPTDAVSISVNARIGGRYATNSFSVGTPEPIDHFGVRIPSDQSGAVVLEIAALGMDECKSASSSVTVDLSQGRSQEVSVSLSALSPRLCSLIIDQYGDGAVTVSPMGIPCGTSCYDYPQGQTTVLKFQPSGRSYGAQAYVSSGGVCDGYNDCSINISRKIMVEAKFQPRLCSSSNWCWHHPLPQGNALKGLSGTGLTDVWAVGDAGTALHYDGQAWTLIPTGVSVSLKGILANAPNSIWVTGDSGTILHWDGRKFSPESITTKVNLNGIWGTSDSNIYIAGDSATILTRTGTGWQEQTGVAGSANNLTKIAGSDSFNIWAIGQLSTILMYDGSQWRVPAKTPGFGPFNDVMTFGKNDVWLAVGTNATDCKVGRWDGAAWLTNTPCQNAVLALSGTSALDVWIAGAEKSVSHFLTSDVSKPMTFDVFSPGSITGQTPTLNAAWSRTIGESYWVTSDGNIVRRVANPGGTQMAGPLPFLRAKNGIDELTAVAGAGGNEYFLFKDGTMFGWDGLRLNTSTNVPLSPVVDSWSAPTGEVIAVGGAGFVYKYSGGSGGTWTSLKSASLNVTVTAVGGITVSDFYVGTDTGTGTGNIYRYSNGATPTSPINATAYSGSIQSIWARSGSEVWAVGGNGTVVRINNGTPSLITVPIAGTTKLTAVSGPPSTSSHVWVVGTAGFAMRFDGTAWTKLTTNVSVDLNSVAVVGESDVWMAGAAGVLLHWDGTRISPVLGPFANRNLIKLHVTESKNVWLVGSGRSIWRLEP